MADTSNCYYGDIYCPIEMKPQLVEMGITVGAYNIRRRCFEACDVPNKETMQRLRRLRGVDHNMVNPKDHPDWWRGPDDDAEQIVEEIEIPF